MSVSPSPSIVLGWREWVALPGLGIRAIQAKVDSGARSSALHVDAQWRFVDGGSPWVGFRLTPGENAAPIECTAAVVDEREVTDSGGHASLRIFVRTPLRVAGIERAIDINLAGRHGMRFPMLLGRSAMARAFTVDPARSYLHGRADAQGALPGVSDPTFNPGTDPR